MKLFKRCGCDANGRCDHPYWYRFWLHRREHRGSTHTANRDLAHRVAIKRQGHTLEGHEKLRKLKTVNLSEHATSYAEWAEKTNRSSLLKDRRVLKGFIAAVGDRPLDDITAFHVERWKTLRAKQVSRSSVNRELNVIRGCFSRAVEWDRLAAGLRDDRANEERQESPGPPHTGASDSAAQARPQARLHLRSGQARQAAAAGGDQRGVRPADPRDRTGRRYASRTAPHGRLRDGGRGNLVARGPGYWRVVDAADARTLRASERRRDGAGGARAHAVHDRHKNRHSGETRHTAVQQD